MKLFLGVDGGQSSTTALIGDQAGRVLGAGRGGPSNHVKGPEGRVKFVNAISGCVNAACERAGLKPEEVAFDGAAFGFSGGPADKDQLLQEMLRMQQMSVTDDALIALVGATAGHPGIITIAGTGSISFGRNTAGKTARSGGWGYVFGDEGGSFDLTRQALRAALRYEEGWGAGTSLYAALLAETGASSANALMHAFYTTDYPRPRIASYSKLVDEAAEAGDTVAREILKTAAQQLAAITGAVRRQLFGVGDAVRVCWIGGAYRSDTLREHFRLLVELEDGVEAGAPLYSPAAGALLEAYRLAGLAIELKDVPEEDK